METIQRRLAWPLHKDDTHKSKARVNQHTLLVPDERWMMISEQETGFHWVPVP